MLKLKRLTKKRTARFWEMVDRRSPDQCWPWLGSLDNCGYGRFKVASYTNGKAHRIAHFIATGADPGSACVCHRCDNRACCNPAHLFLGDHATNMADMVRKGRAVGGSAKGENSRRAILSLESVAEIREAIARGERNPEIAKRYGVGDDIISRIRRGRAWGLEPIGERYASLRR